MPPKNLFIILAIGFIFIPGIFTALWFSDIINVQEHVVIVLSVILGLGTLIFRMNALKKGSSSLLGRRQGTVKWFNPTKGFGFIEQDQGEDLFVHQTEISQSGFRSLNKSDRVEFEVATGKKGPVAKNVRRIDTMSNTFQRETEQSVSEAIS